MAAKANSANSRPNTKMAGPKFTMLAPGIHLKNSVVASNMASAAAIPIPAPIHKAAITVSDSIVATC